MKRVSLQQVLKSSANLKGEFFPLYVTDKKRILQTPHTTNFCMSHLLSGNKKKQQQLQRTMNQYGKAFLYVNDYDYVKHF